jgi:hypothetical protein
MYPTCVTPKELLTLAIGTAVQALRTEVVEQLYSEMKSDPGRDRHLVYVGDYSSSLLALAAADMQKDGFTIEVGPIQTGYSGTHWYVGGWAPKKPDTTHREGPYR